MQVQAHAKLNLGLWVLDRRTDGFHNLLTIFHRIRLADSIDVEATERAIVVSSDSPDIPCDESNLCWKAADALRRRAGTNKGAAIRLTKRIPVGAGLGGGSSDAAAVLLSLVALWQLPLNETALAETALEVGSDVPYFLRRGSAVARGRGEQLRYVDLRLPYWIVVVTPRTRIATRWAYEELGRYRESEPVKRTEPPPSSGVHTQPLDLSLWMHNDFEAPVFAAHREIHDIKRALLGAGAEYALMSGSGSSVFGLFASEQSATAAAECFGSPMIVSLTEPNFSPA